MNNAAGAAVIVRAAPYVLHVIFQQEGRYVDLWSIMLD